MKNTLKAAKQDLMYRIMDLGMHGRAMTAATDLFARKKLIFCITNGRTGTETLARRFECVNGVAGRHEPDPSFHTAMRWTQRNEHLARNFWLYAKLPAIASVSEPVYLETSHLFAKGFFEPLIAIGGRPALISLSRDKRKTALSMYALHDIPGRTRRAVKYYLSPDDAHHVGLRDPGALSDYQLCYWQTLETEARQRHYEREAQRLGLDFAEIDLADIDAPGAFQELCSKLGVELDAESRERIDKLRSHQANARTSEKRPVPFTPGQLEEEEQHLRKHVVEVSGRRVAQSNLPVYGATLLRGL